MQIKNLILDALTIRPEPHYEPGVCVYVKEMSGLPRGVPNGTICLTPETLSPKQFEDDIDALIKELEGLKAKGRRILGSTNQSLELDCLS